MFDILCHNKVCHGTTYKESVLSADVGPPEMNIINRLKCNMLPQFSCICITVGDNNYY